MTTIMEKDPNENDSLLNIDHPKDDTDRTCLGLGTRHIVATLGFLAFFFMYCLRTSMSMALVAMVNSTWSTSDRKDNFSDDCPVTTDSNNSTIVSSGEFKWDEKTQGAILGAFYYGYVISQVPGGWIADQFGGKKLMGYSCLLSFLLSFLIPSASRAGSSYLIALRIAQGLMEGPSCPSMQVMFAKWSPIHERSKLAATSNSGCEVGIMFSMLITGLLCRYGFAGGWPSAFYIYGTLGCIWFVLWMVLVSNSPADHPRISDYEKRYILKSLGPRQSVPTPWYALATSGAVWAICIAHTTSNWAYYTLLTCLPTYMKHILHFDIVANGFLSALPYLVMCMSQVASGIAADCIRRHLSTGFTRKLMLTFGTTITTCFLIGASYVKCDHTVAVVLLTFGVAGQGITNICTLINQLDIAPRFAGILFGLSNSLAATPGFLGPYILGVMTYENQTIDQWRKFFCLTTGICCTGTLVFLALGKGEEQPWAKAHSAYIPTLPVDSHHKKRSLKGERERSIAPTETRSLLPTDTDGVKTSCMF